MRGNTIGNNGKARGNAIGGNYYTPFSLRISETLMDKIKIIAAQNKRSANKEIEYALEQYVAQFDVKTGE